MKTTILTGLVLAAAMLTGCAVCTGHGNVSEDGWPAPQRCGELFDQSGTASMRVADCAAVRPNDRVQVVTDAQNEADRLAGLRCPNRCPTERVQWLTNQAQTCVNDQLSQTVTGRYRCKR